MKITKFLFCIISFLICSISIIHAKNNITYNPVQEQYHVGGLHPLFKTFRQSIIEGNIPMAKLMLRRSKKVSQYLGNSSNAQMYNDIVNYSGNYKIKGRGSLSPLMLALSSNDGHMLETPFKRSKMIHFLVENGANPKTFYIHNCPIIAYCAALLRNPYVNEEYLDIMQYLIDHGADVNAWNGGTPAIECVLCAYRSFSDIHYPHAYDPKKADLCWKFAEILVKNGAYLDEVGFIYEENKILLDNLLKIQE